MKLILIRHGKTEANEHHLYCGSTDLSLSVSGKAALETLKDIVSYPDISGFRVITSGMKRCEETLITLFGNIKHDKMPQLCEMNFGAFEMRSYDQMKNDPQYIMWISGDNEANTAPGGESGVIMSSRVLAAFNKIVDEKNDSLVITHGGPIATIMQYIFPKEHKNRYEWQPKPGCGYYVLINSESCSYSVIE